MKYMFGNCCGYGYNDKDCYNMLNIPNYGEDHNYADNAWDGNNYYPQYQNQNLPALLAARTSGGIPNYHDANNGINSNNYFDAMASRAIPEYGARSSYRGEGIFNIPSYSY